MLYGYVMRIDDKYSDERYGGPLVGLREERPRYLDGGETVSVCGRVGCQVIRDR